METPPKQRTTILDTLRYVFDRIMEELAGPDFLMLVFIFFIFQLFKHGYFTSGREDLLTLLMGGFMTYFTTRAKLP